MYIFLVVILIILDQLTKNWALSLKGKSNIVLIDKFLELSYVENRGAAFGILQGRSILFFIITIGVLIFILRLFKKYPLMSSWMKLSLSLIAAGAIGNFIDRLARGYVIDFIFVRFWGYYDFPVFNVADICVVVGVIIMIILALFTKELDEIGG